MNLWISSHFLLVGLFLSVSALTPEECQPLVTPLSLADHSVMYGRRNLIVGYADTEEYNAILKSTDSYWMNVTQSPFSTIPNITTLYHVLPSCDGCLLLSANSTARGLDKLFHFFKINSTISEREVNSRALYLMAKESTLKDSDVEHFKRQASCLGFSGEPDFHYDPKKAFCEDSKLLLVT